MPEKKVHIEASWNAALKDEFSKDYFQKLREELHRIKAEGQTIYPPGPKIFHAFNLTPIEQVKVVILGQDPYHNPGEAMGLCFSVPRGVKVPPSLKNIYKEMHDDIGTPIPQHGDLTHWAREGVFLLNAMLTVEKNKPASHRNLGWQDFTDRVIATISEKRENVVFLLWGRFAQNKAGLIDAGRHLVLQSAHPSPLAGRAFFGNHHFSKTNAYLIKHHKSPINWKII